MVPFGVFANQFLDVVFTAFFGFVAVDMMLLIGCLMPDQGPEGKGEIQVH